jgi:threonine dehydrogenase-like Zn-dependent dehydrogenase
MRATVMYEAGDVRVEDVPDARLIDSTDALVRVTRAAICGSDLWPYKSMPHADAGRRMGHEFIGVVEAVGADVETVNAGDLVVSPFLWSDGTCVFSREGLPSECLHGGRYGADDVDGGQGLEFAPYDCQTVYGSSSLWAPDRIPRITSRNVFCAQAIGTRHTSIPANTE